MLINLNEFRGWHLSWSGSFITGTMKRDWGNGACSAWGREGNVTEVLPMTWLPRTTSLWGTIGKQEAVVKKGRFKLQVRKIFFIVRIINTGIRIQQGCIISVLGNVWVCPENPHLTSVLTLLWAAGWTRDLLMCISAHGSHWFYRVMQQVLSWRRLLEFQYRLWNYSMLYDSHFCLAIWKWRLVLIQYYSARASSSEQRCDTHQRAHLQHSWHEKDTIPQNSSYVAFRVTPRPRSKFTTDPIQQHYRPR